MQYGSHFHPSDDCCTEPTTKPAQVSTLGKPECKGRNFPGGNECCESEDQLKCREGQGDCDSDAGCQGDLVCGRNNCMQYGSHFHPSDDCCTQPASKPVVIPAGIPAGNYVALGAECKTNFKRCKTDRSQCRRKGKKDATGKKGLICDCAGGSKKTGEICVDITKG